MALNMILGASWSGIPSQVSDFRIRFGSSTPAALSFLYTTPRLSLKTCLSASSSHNTPLYKSGNPYRWRNHKIAWTPRGVGAQRPLVRSSYSRRSMCRHPGLRRRLLMHSKRKCPRASISRLNLSLNNLAFVTCLTFVHKPTVLLMR